MTAAKVVMSTTVRPVEVLQPDGTWVPMVADVGSLSGTKSNGERKRRGEDEVLVMTPDNRWIVVPRRHVRKPT